MEARIYIFYIGISDGHPVLNRHIEALVSEAVYVMVMRVSILDGLRRAPRDPCHKLKKHSSDISHHSFARASAIEQPM